MGSKIQTDQGDGIFTIDTGFMRKNMVASHLIISNGRVAFVDVGVSSCAHVLLDALAEHKLSPKKVDYIMVTHVHLDHAGAAGLMMSVCPNAKLVVHPHGARHMIDPAKLIAGAIAVYGEADFASLFGEVRPVAADRVIEVYEGDVLEWRGREWQFFDTPGHARHHYCMLDSVSNGLFAGDTFGLSYPELETENGPFVFPTTTPVQFDPKVLADTVTRLAELESDKLFLTHFGCIEMNAAVINALLRRIQHFVDVAQAHFKHPNRVSEMTTALEDYCYSELTQHGCKSDRTRVEKLMALDCLLNAQGLDCWLEQTA
ncbi:MAG TPA: MBL fold metallo-hydrolase [Gammaproteobacteria bacterium]|nr:MBL fold metallo-hydrolase [Gammaproteobacteria bacterium]